MPWNYKYAYTLPTRILKFCYLSCLVFRYVHRVGRTARAGCGGRAVTLVGDSRRRVVKEVLKGPCPSSTAQAQDGEDAAAAGLVLAGASGPGQVLSRAVPAAVVAKFVAQIASLESRISQALEEERTRAKVEAAHSGGGKKIEVNENKSSIV